MCEIFCHCFGGFPNYVTTIERQNVLKLELFLNHYHLNKAIIRPFEASFGCKVVLRKLVGAAVSQSVRVLAPFTM